VPVATACANLALVKYWGKRDLALNLPAAGSLSLTLDALRTWTEVEPDPSLADDVLELDGRAAGGRPLDRIRRHLDRLRPPDAPRARVRSVNAFPAAAGLASSASGFAALTVAGAAAYGLEADAGALSALARQGSGSACRSLFDGFARWDVGVAADGHDSRARPVESRVELAAAVMVVDAGEKAIGSTEGMERTRATSPYHDAWIALVERDLEAAVTALADGDLERLTEVVEGSCLAMHANAMAARPGILYWKGATLWGIERVRALRAEGVPVMFTIDAGPHVVAFTVPAELERVATALEAHPEVARVVRSSAGRGAHLVDAMPERQG
jgi:diphosphomevalonate decarboxylase